MPRRNLENHLDRVEDQIAGGSRGSDLPIDTIEHRDADPKARPDGMEYDPESDLLAYDFWASQTECLSRLDDAESDLIAFLGGYRSGKTVTGARWELTEALRYPSSRWLAMGVSYSEASGTTYRTLFEQLPGARTHLLTSSFNGPETSPLVADYNRQEHRLTLVNDSVIVLGSADKWSRYAGDEYSGIWLDEPSHYGDELYDILEMLGSRLTAPRGPKVQFWSLTGNGFNSAFSILSQREDKNGDPISLDIDLIRASVLDNPYIDESDKDRLRRQFGGTGREEQALFGGFAAAQGLVYSKFARDTHVINASEASALVDGDWRIFGYDAGWDDPRVVLEVGRTNYDQLVVLDEYHESGSHVEDAIKWLKRNDKPRGKIYAEHEPSDIEKFRKAGWSAEKASKSIDAGISEVRERFELDESGRPGLLVSEQCEHLIREILGYQEEQVGTSSAVDHCVDALRYLVFTPVADPPVKRVTRQGTPSQVHRQRRDREDDGSEEERSGGNNVVRRRSPSMNVRSGTSAASDRERQRKAESKKREWFGR